MTLIPLILAAASAPMHAEAPEPAPRPPVLVAPAPPPYPVYAPPAPPPPPPPPPRPGEPRTAVQRSGTITSDDYPATAIRAGHQGATTVRIGVTPDGRVDRCTVTSSSGSAILDHATCALITRRFRYSPALDASGRPTLGEVTRTVLWRLPDDGPEPVPFANGWVLVSVPRIDAASTVVHCGEIPGTPSLAPLAADLCSEFLPEGGPAAAAGRPARRALLVLSGGAGTAIRPPAQRGRLVYREQVRFEVGGDGRVANCRTGPIVNLWGEDRFDLCRFLDTSDAPFFSPGPPSTAGQITLEVYE